MLRGNANSWKEILHYFEYRKLRILARIFGAILFKFLQVLKGKQYRTC